MNPQHSQPPGDGSRPAASAPTPAPRVLQVDRTVLIPAMPLEDLLTPEHHARTIWQFVQGLDLTPLYATIRAVEGGPGRPATDPPILVISGPSRLMYQNLMPKPEGTIFSKRSTPQSL